MSSQEEEQRIVRARAVLQSNHRIGVERKLYLSFLPDTGWMTGFEADDTTVLDAIIGTNYFRWNTRHQVIPMILRSGLTPYRAGVTEHGNLMTEPLVLHLLTAPQDVERKPDNWEPVEDLT